MEGFYLCISVEICVLALLFSVAAVYLAIFECRLAAFAPMVVLEKITAIGKERMTFPVLAHTLPPSAGVDGLLGLDFLRGEVLTVDFRLGEIIVT